MSNQILPPAELASLVSLLTMYKAELVSIRASLLSLQGDVAAAIAATTGQDSKETLAGILERARDAHGILLELAEDVNPSFAAQLDTRPTDNGPH